jgi:UDP-N-acetyl-D-glucosamine dehydrogenase
MVIVLESTTYPGTTREILLPKLSEAGSMAVGQDFFLAFSPERVDPGRQDWTTINTPKVMGGITPACSEISAAWYAQAIQKVVPVSSAEVAEMAKLLENTFRMVNIGMVNEMAIMCDRLGIDVWEVIEAAATKPFGFMKFTPGPGLGGHCIPIDPLYLSWKLKTLNYRARFIELAGEVNSAMPHHVVDRTLRALNGHGKSLKGSKVLVLGLSYKADIDDDRESPSFEIIERLRASGAEVAYCDPYIPVARAGREHDIGLASVPCSAEEFARHDVLLVSTAHSDFKKASLYAGVKLVVDTRNLMAPLGFGAPGAPGPEVLRA